MGGYNLATDGTGVWVLLLAIGIVGCVPAVWRWHIPDGGARPFWKQVLWALGSLAVALLAFILTQTVPFSLNLPQVVGGTQIQAVSSVTGILHFTARALSIPVVSLLKSSGLGFRQCLKVSGRQHAPWGSNLGG